MKAISSSNSPGNDVIFRSFPEFLTEVDAESEFSIQEEMIEKVMQELYKEITTPPESTCRDYSKAEEEAEAEAAASSPSIMSSLSSERGKSSSSESCGASVSDSASSVMAGVEFVGCGGMFGSGNMSMELSDDMAKVEESEEGGMMNGCDGVEFGDEWLEKVMGWTPLAVEGWI